MSRTEKPASSKSPVLGIDVSRFQGTIDWDQVAAARIRNPVTGRDEPIRFAYIRSSGAGWVDSQFRRNWSEAKRVKIQRGPYVAITAAAYQNGPESYYRSLIEALGNDYGATDLPPMLDHEKGQAPDPTDEQSRANVRVVKGIADMIERGLGRTPGVYSGAYWQWSVPADVQATMARYPLWVPDYRQISQPGPWSARIPDGWKGFYIRQFTSQYRIPGITANTCDVNLYDGGLASLVLFTARSHVTAIPWWGYVVAGVLIAGVAGYFLVQADAGA